MMKNWVLGGAAALLMSVAAMAAPAPFGLEIGKASIQDMKAAHSAKSAGTNAYSGGDMFELDVSRIEFEGLKHVLVIFNPSGKVEAVLATLDKERFDAVAKGLSGKYKTVSKQLPFVGNKKMVWADGNTEIVLDAPHLSFDMKMQYATKDLLRKFQQTSNDNSKAKAKNEASQL